MSPGARQKLRAFRAPDEAGSEERAWEVVRRAYQQRLPIQPRRSYRRPVAAMAAGVVLVAKATFSPRISWRRAKVNG